jgi:eukaryotic-like serine/threonine-protein kinase
MTVSVGSRLGPYEVLSPLGAGGMGEVWLARDPRLGREVAVKVLPEEFSSDRERVKRFEREARAASALNHPNIVTIHEIGEADGRAFLVMERIEGQTLRELLIEGPLPMRRLLSIAAQAADGLARAHESGIVHRDLKPDNVMVTKDGFVKILDFGLAKLLSAETAPPPLAEAPTATAGTAAGIVLGTVGYMSPEQASGKPLDHRSDQFSLGAILYEMASGRRAFEKSTPVETLSAIIREDPEPIGAVNPRVPAPLQWTIERCLAKKPEDRYVATRDLARDLASFRDHLSETTAPAESLPAPPRTRRLLWPVLAGVLLLAAVAIGSFFLGTHTKKKTSLPSFHRLTFRRGQIWTARFTPDGQTVVYGAAWDGKPAQIYSTRPGNPESVPLSLPSADVLSVSPAGELAICLGRHNIGTWETAGTLARAPLSGSAPREILESVAAADWNPDGSRLALVHVVGEVFRLEYPEGRTLSESPGWISHPRVSPRGDAVAFFDHPVQGDDAGRMWLADSSGRKKALSRAWYSAQGLAWSPGGKEIWFTASDQSVIRALHAVTPEGKERVIAEFVGTLQDISRDGRVLVTRDMGRARVLGRHSGEAKERDLSWFDTSIAADLSADGTMLLFYEGGEGSIGGSNVYLRRTDGSSAVRLGDGNALALSPDGRWALSTTKDNSELHLLPTGVGEARRIESYVDSYQWAGFLPGGKQILFAGREKGRPARLFVQDLGTGVSRARPVTPEGAGAGYLGHAISADGRFVTGPGADSRFLIYPVKGGAPTPIAGLTAGEVPVQWSADGQFLYVYRPLEVPSRIFRLELSTGRRELWKELLPDDLAGVNVINAVLLTRDGRSYAYSCGQFLNDLYLVEGLK